MTTYIYHKDSTLLAFEGPEEWPMDYYPQTSGESIKYKEHIQAMSTARESALPVVDDEPLKGSGIEITKEPVALPGWALEKVYQKLNEFEKPSEWLEVSKTEFDYFNSNIDLMGTYRQAYRLVRSEPEKKPDNSAHSFTEGADTGERFYMNFQTGHNAVKPSESQEETYKAMLGKQISYRYVDWEEGSFSPWQTCTEKHLKSVFHDASIDVIQFKP